MHGGSLDGFDLFIAVAAIFGPGLLAGLLVSLARGRGGLATIAIAAALAACGLFLFLIALFGDALDPPEIVAFAGISLVPSLLGAIVGASFGAVLADRLAERRADRD